MRESERFPLTARGDINTYAVFAELFRRLLNPCGRAGVIVPTGIATDDTTKEFFGNLVESSSLVSLYDFENRQGLFPEVDSRMKFSLLTLQNSTDHKIVPANFILFATQVEHLSDPNRRFALSAEDFSLLNPNTRTCPVFRTRADAELTKQIYRNVPVLVNEQTGENPWGIKFLRMFDMSNDSHLFRTRDQLEREGFRLMGSRFVKGSDLWLPLYEGKMIQAFDHRASGVITKVQNLKRPGQPVETSLHQHLDPLHVPVPQYWIERSGVDRRLPENFPNWSIGFKSVTSPTNERTFITSLLLACGVGNSMPLLLGDFPDRFLLSCFFSNLNSLVFDFVTKQKTGGVNLNFFVVEQFPTLPPTAYTTSNLEFIIPRVLELVYTAWDIKAFADDTWRDANASLRAHIQKQHEENKKTTGGNEWKLPDWIEAYPEIEWNRDKGIPLPPFKWDETRRAILRAELDAYYAKLYGLTRKQLRYILDPADLTERELQDILEPWEEVSDPLDPAGNTERTAKSTFHGETFRVLKEKELKHFGEYRTRRLVLEAWSRLSNVVKVERSLAHG